MPATANASSASITKRDQMPANRIAPHFAFSPMHGRAGNCEQARLLDSSLTHTVWFRSLCDEARSYVFARDAAGRVDLDSLNDRARNNYSYARALVGRNFEAPSVQLGPLH